MGSRESDVGRSMAPSERELIAVVRGRERFPVYLMWSTSRRESWQSGDNGGREGWASQLMTPIDGEWRIEGDVNVVVRTQDFREVRARLAAEIHC